MHYEYTNRPGFLLGFIDFFTAGLFFLLYMPLGGLQDEIESVLGHKVIAYPAPIARYAPSIFISWLFPRHEPTGGSFLSFST